MSVKSRIKGKVGEILDLDMGWDALLQTVTRVMRDKPALEVGIVGDEAQNPHPSSKTGETIAQIAARHEFGIGVPERSFLRATFEANKRTYQGLMVEGLADELLSSIKQRRAFDAKSAASMKRLALVMEGDVKKRIAAGIPPPNSPRTIKRKGSSTPLIDSGVLRRSIGSIIRTGRRS